VRLERQSFLPALLPRGGAGGSGQSSGSTQGVAGTPSLPSHPLQQRQQITELNQSKMSCRNGSVKQRRRSSSPTRAPVCCRRFPFALLRAQPAPGHPRAGCPSSRGQAPRPLPACSVLAPPSLLPRRSAGAETLFFPCSLDTVEHILTPGIVVVLLLLAVAAGVLMALSRKRKKGKRSCRCPTHAVSAPEPVCCCIWFFPLYFFFLPHSLPDPSNSWIRH